MSAQSGGKKKGGRGPGVTNFSAHDTRGESSICFRRWKSSSDQRGALALLEIMRRVVPLGDRDWDEVARLFNGIPGIAQRSVTSLRGRCAAFPAFGPCVPQY